MYNRPEFAQLDFIQSSVFVLEVTPEGLPVYAAFNTFGLAVTGRPFADFMGRSAAEVFDGAFGKLATQRHLQVVQTGEPLTFELALPFGREEPQVRTTLTPVLDGAGKVTMIYGAITDISAQQRADELAVSLRTLNTEVEQFVSMAAHDLRAPMRNVSQLADMLREDFSDQGDGKMELINMLDEVASKSTGLITDILAHANATTTQANVKTFYFADLCREVCDVLDPRGLGLYSYTTACVRTDHAVLQISLRNIVENAIKNCTSSQLQLDITITKLTEKLLQVRLHDNGAGFSAPALRFFDDGSFRVDSGYGLLGVKRLLTTRGGTITAYNDPSDGGGVVQFTLPGTLLNQQAMSFRPAKSLIMSPEFGQTQR